MTFETIAALIVVVLALLAGAGFFIAPLLTRVNAIDTKIEALSGAGKLLTDYKESTIEKLTRAEEKLRALSEQVQADRIVTESHVKALRDQMAFEIGSQVQTRLDQVRNVADAVAKLDVRLLAITNESREQLTAIVALKAEVAHLTKDRDPVKS